MKVLKKIKARIGLSHKHNQYNPPAQPLEFHPVHGDNILLSADNTIAARYVQFLLNILVSQVKCHSRVHQATSFLCYQTSKPMLPVA